MIMPTVQHSYKHVILNSRIFVKMCDQWKEEKLNKDHTVPKFNVHIVDTEAKYIHLTHIYDR